MGGPSLTTVGGLESLEIIGEDDNTLKTTIGGLKRSVDVVDAIVVAADVTEPPPPPPMGLHPSTLPDTKRAFEALSAVNTLQDQLL